MDLAHGVSPYLRLSTNELVNSLEVTVQGSVCLSNDLKPRPATVVENR